VSGWAWLFAAAQLAFLGSRLAVPGSDDSALEAGVIVWHIIQQHVHAINSRYLLWYLLKK
jgi:hypothetical protein